MTGLLNFFITPHMRCRQNNERLHETGIKAQDSKSSIMYAAYTGSFNSVLFIYIAPVASNRFTLYGKDPPVTQRKHHQSDESL